MPRRKDLPEQQARAGQGTPSEAAKPPSRWRGWPVLLFAGLALAGIFGHEAAEILFNATLLCLSCMGLGR